MMHLNIKKTFPGRVVDIAGSETAYIGQNYKMFSADVSGRLRHLATVPCSGFRRMSQVSRLMCRLLRQELRGAAVLADGSKVVATRQGLFYGEADDVLLRLAKMPELAPELKGPAAMLVDSLERVIWGEYWANPDLRSVRMLVSYDKGRSYEPFWQFKPGEIKHVHNIVEDPYDDCYWVLVGDHGSQPGMGRLSRDFTSFEWLVKGEQKCRAVCVFPLEDRLVYATDSEKEDNFICTVDKSTGKWEELCQIPGSCIYAARFGKWYTVSTTVEHFETHDTKEATLWVSSNASDWQQVFSAEKDIWPMTTFQFGSLVLPKRGGWDNDHIIFSGQAVKKYDNVVCIAEVVEQ